MNIPKLNFVFISRFLIILAIVLLILNKFKYNSSILNYISVLLAILSIVFMIAFIVQIKRGNIDANIQILLETNVDKAVKEGTISEDEAKSIPKKIVINAKDFLLNIIFNFAIINHFDLIPIEVLHESLPEVPPAQLMSLYEESRKISDDLNTYFRSQKFANKADVIMRADEIKGYLSINYPWMAEDTLKNTYNYFFLGINNG